MRVLLALCLIILFGCSKTSEPLPAGLEYFPDIDLMEEGLVFKYYFHRGKKDAHPKTDIRYHKMTLEDDLILVENYNAGFQKTYQYKIQIEGSQWKTLEEKSYNYRNDYTELYKEYNYTFKDNIHTDWGKNDAVQEKTVMYEEVGSRSRKIQTEIKDSIPDGVRMMVIRGKRIFYSIIGGEEKEPAEFDVYRRFEENLGMTYRLMSNDTYKYEMQLDEIMTLKEFERRADHGTHRVAYIDTLKTIDDHTLFSPCFHLEKINDYYNDKRAGFKGGKGRLRALLKDKLDPSKLGEESGYLTFRFVVNCNGEAGWFVTEEAGLDYEKKQFSEPCRMHLYEILSAEKEWDNLVIGIEDRDAYTYITFKMKNGEIIELLP